MTLDSGLILLDLSVALNATYYILLQRVEYTVGIKGNVLCCFQLY